MSDGKEMRIAVAMTGGVSLAIWMGGVATELMHLATALSVSTSDDDPNGKGVSPSQAKYREWLEEEKYTSTRLDVLAGTSAGGLNAALLGSALAWGVDPQEFKNRLRSTWLSVGSIQNLLRSPFDSDQPSLLKGDDYFKPQVEQILNDWETAQEPEKPIHLLITCTLLTPVEKRYVDESGRSILEVDHRGLLEFDTEDFGRTGVAQKIALAARTSASYPVAFEASWLPVTDGQSGGVAGPDLTGHAEFKSSRFAIDGGILANKPLNRAFQAIFEQRADRPVDRKLIYVVPVRGVTTSAESPSEDEPPHVAQILGHTISIPLSQSLRDDLEDVRRHELRMAVQQSNRKKWLVQLDAQAREKLTDHIWPVFKEMRSLSSVTATLSRALKRSRESGPGREVVQAVGDGRAQVDWHLDTFEGTLAEPAWPWGLTAITYMTQVLLDVVREGAARILEARTTLPESRGVVEEQRQSALDVLEDLSVDMAAIRESLHRVLEQVRVIRRIDEKFWVAVLEGAPEPPSATRALWQEWSARCYGSWPTPPGEWTPPLPGVSSNSSEAVGKAAELAVESAPPNLGWTSLQTQDEARLAMSALGNVLKDAANSLVELIRGEVGPLGLEPNSIRLITEMGDVGPLRLLSQLWVIQVATQPDGIGLEQPIDLVLVHSDNAVSLDPSRRRDARQKLAGLQMARFGGFYKRSWRANDFLWGRLDAAERIGDMLLTRSEDRLEMEAQAENHDLPAYRERQQRRAQTAKRELQAQIVAEESDHLLRAMDHSVAEGAWLGADARALQGQLSRSSKDRESQAAEILGANRIGEERIIEEISSDAFVSTSTHALAVGINALRSERSGFGPLRTFFGYLRNGIALPSYLLGQAVVSSTKLGIFALALALAFAIGVGAVQLIEGAELPRVTLLAAVGIAVSFYFWVAIVDGVVSFYLAGTGLLALAIAALSEIPNDLGAYRAVVGWTGLVLIGLAVLGAIVNRQPMQFVFLLATVLGPEIFLSLSLDTVDLPVGFDEFLWATAPLTALLLAHGTALIREEGWSTDGLGHGARSFRRARHITRRAPRVILVQIVLLALTVFNFASIVQRSRPTSPDEWWVEASRFIHAYRGSLAILVLALPIIIGVLVRPGWRFRKWWTGRTPSSPVSVETPDQ